MKLTNDQKEDLDGLFDETILGAIYDEIATEPFNPSAKADKDEDEEQLREMRKACAKHLISRLKEYDYDT